MGPRGDVLHRKVRHRVCERHAHQSRGVWNIPAPSKRTASSRLLQIPRKQGQHIGPLIVRNDVRSLHASAYSNLRPDQILILTPMEGWGEGLPAMPNSSICFERGKDTAFVEK